MELARTLALDPQLAGNVELLFLDGDAPFRELTLNDGLFGSRFYAQMLRINGHAGDIRAAILLDNVGSATLNYLPNSDPEPGWCAEESRDALGVQARTGQPFASCGSRTVCTGGYPQYCAPRCGLPVFEYRG